MNIQQPLLHPPARNCFRSFRDRELDKITAIGIFTLLGCLTIATTTQLSNLGNNNNGWMTTCTVGVCTDLTLHYRVNLISSIFSTLFLVANVMIGISMTPSKKAYKIGVPILIGSGIATAISLNLPENCTKIAGLSPPYYDKNRCLKRVFALDTHALFFPNCTMAPLNPDWSDTPGGFCTNTTIHQSDWGIWEHWVYDSTFPSINVTSIYPGLCSNDSHSRSVTSTWEPTTANTLVGAANYWTVQNPHYFVPANIVSTHTLVRSLNHGNWEGFINSTGWTMVYHAFDHDICVKTYAKLPAFILECGSEAFRQNYTNLFDPSIESYQEELAAYNQVAHQCRPWIKYLLYTNPSIFPAHALAAGIFVLYLDSQERALPPLPLPLPLPAPQAAELETNV